MSEMGLNRRMIRGLYPQINWDEYDREVVAEALDPRPAMLLRRTARPYHAALHGPSMAQEDCDSRYCREIVSYLAAPSGSPQA